MRFVNFFRATLCVASCAALAPVAAAADTIPGFYRAPVPEVPPDKWEMRSRDCRQSVDLKKALYECKYIIKLSMVEGRAKAAYHNRCAEIEILLGKFDDAIADLEIAIQEDPATRDYEKNLAIAKGAGGVQTEAPRFTSLRLPAVLPGRAMLNVNVCAQSADLEMALLECRKIIRKSDLDGKRLSAIYTRCVEIDLALGRNAEAVEDADKALQHNPGNRKLEANLAFVKARAGL